MVCAGAYARDHAMKLKLAPLALLLAGCGGAETTSSGPSNDGTASGPTESQGPGNEPLVSELGGPRDTMVAAFQSDADMMLDLVSQSASDGYIIGNINLGLLDSQFDCELTYEPEIAESFSWNEDQTVFTIKLRDDIKWDDGTPFTAKDIAFSFELIADPLVASPRISYIERMVEGSRPEVIDDHTVAFHFTQPYDRITMTAHTSSLAFAAEHVLRDADRSTLRGHDYNRNPPINGPFKLAQWVPDQKIVLEPNEKFTGPEAYKPRLKRVIFKIIPEYATRLLELENGSVDWMEGILVSDADRIAAEHPEIELYRRGWRFIDYLAWNRFDAEDFREKHEAAGKELDWGTVEEHAFFADPAVRRALTKAIDIDKLIGDLLTSQSGEAYGTRAVSTITPTLCNTINDEIDLLPFDPAQARADLEGLGFTDADGNGVLEKDGQEFRFTMMTNSGNARRAKAAVIIQSFLSDVGVKMEIETVESNTFFERLRKKDYEAALSGWSAGLFVDMSTIWHSGQEYEFNFVSYENAEVDALIEQGLNEPDTQKANEIWKQVQARIYEDQPYTFLYWRDDIVGVHQRFNDVKVDILSPMNDLHTWWVPAGETKYDK